MKSNIAKATTCGVLVAGLALLSGCATVVHGTHQQNIISSVPNGANITVDGRYYGKTPVEVDLKRNEPHEIEFTYPGYAPIKLKMNRTVSGWWFGNLWFGGVPGLVLDTIDGSIFRLVPGIANGAPSSSVKVNGQTITVYFTHNIDPKYKGDQVGQLQRS